MSKEIHVYCIGSDGTEIYAAHSEDEMRQWYRQQLGGDEFCEEDLRDNFAEIPEIDAEFDFNDDGQTIRTTWRKLAERCKLPNQLSTGYN